MGSKGLALSGGQKQRVVSQSNSASCKLKQKDYLILLFLLYKALARAVYSRPQIALFDDIFSGLDNATSQRIFKNLFSSNTGLLRKWKTTILLATQSGLFYSFAA